MSRHGAEPLRSTSLLGAAVLVALAGVTLAALWALTSFVILGGLRHDGVWLLIVLVLAVALALALAAWRAELRERAEPQGVPHVHS